MKNTEEKNKVKKKNIPVKRFRIPNKKHMKLPREIPIIFNGIKFGEIKVDFVFNEEEMDTNEKRELLWQILIELSNLSRFVANEVELSLKMQKNSLGQDDPSYGILAGLYLPPDKSYELMNYLLGFKDEYIFEWIKKEGPILLRNTTIQKKINEWLSDEKTASTKINKLRDALLDYEGLKDKLFPIGRPKTEVIRRFGTDWIKDLYQDIISLLRIVKRTRKYNQNKNIAEVMDKAFNTHFTSLMNENIGKQASQDMEIKIMNIERMLNFYKLTKFPNPISLCIENDEYMSEEFDNLLREPNFFAKKIIAKLLDVSESTAESIIHRRASKT